MNHKLNVVLISSDGRKTVGTVVVQEWNQKQRLKRSLKVFLLVWGLAFISILIPLAHFILVPSFLLAGPFVAFHYYQIERMIEGGKGICPNCRKNFPVVKSALKWPLNDICSACHEAVVVSPSEEAF
jgi:hypothetical protein